MRETEITVEVFNNLKDIESILINNNFKMVENYQMNDYYFSKYNTTTLKGMSYLEILNNSMLVREILDENPKTQLVYKSKELDNFGNVIAETKTATKVDNKKNTLKILNNAGLNMWCEVNNNSFVYQREDMAFCVQVIKDLGIFIEYEEDDTMLNMTETEKFEYMKNNIKTLGLNLGTDFSCKKVYMKFLKQ